MKTVVKVLVQVGLAIVSSLFAGLVLSKMWGWFIVPKFAGAPALDYLSAVGVNITIGFFFSSLYWDLHMSQAKEKDEDSLAVAIVKSLVKIVIFYPLVLLVGWVWHQFL